MTDPASRPDAAPGPLGDTASTTVLVACERPTDPARATRAGVLVRRLSTALPRPALPEVVVAWLDPGDTDSFWTQAARVRPALAIVLDGGESDMRARLHATAPASGGPVLLDASDASAVVLTAATLVAVNQRRRRTGAARVLIVCPDRLPGLNPLLFAADVGELTLWNPPDATFAPLHRVAEGVDVVIDLSGLDGGALPPESRQTLSTLVALGRDQPPVVLAPDRWADPLLVLPALAHTLVDSPWVRADLARLDLTYHDMCYACALELVMATPGRQTDLPGPSRRLDQRLAAAAARALAPSSKQHPHGG